MKGLSLRHARNPSSSVVSLIKKILPNSMAEHLSSGKQFRCKLDDRLDREICQVCYRQPSVEYKPNMDVESSGKIVLKAFPVQDVLQFSVDGRLIKLLLALSKWDLSFLVISVLTGHLPLRYHQKLNEFESAKCRACEKGNKALEQSLCECQPTADWGIISSVMTQTPT